MARPRPSAPPKTPGTSPSVSRSVTTRRRLAPSAARTASSFLRRLARANMRPITFEHAMSSTKPGRTEKEGADPREEASRLGMDSRVLLRHDRNDTRLAPLIEPSVRVLGTEAANRNVDLR